MSWWKSSEICSILVCPVCKTDVQIDVNDAGEGVAACLSSECGENFPVIAGIPRFLTGDARKEFLRQEGAERTGTDNSHSAQNIEQIQTRTRRQYSRTWERIYQYHYSKQPFNMGEPPSALGTFQKFLQEISLEQSEIILDAGCGQGRFMACACHLASKGIVVGVDLSRGVDFAYRVVRHTDERYLQRCLAVQASLFALPFKPHFDRIFSFGVLHHTPEPQKAFEECLHLTAAGGQTLAWLYGDDFKQKHVLLWHLIHLARQLHSKIHPEVLWGLCNFYALFAPLMKWRYDFSFNKARFYWLDNLSNPFNFVFNREELMNWSSGLENLIEYYHVDPLFGGWRVETKRKSN